MIVMVFEMDANMTRLHRKRIHACKLQLKSSESIGQNSMTLIGDRFRFRCLLLLGFSSAGVETV